MIVMTVIKPKTVFSADQLKVNVRHQQVSTSVRQAAACRWGSLLVVATGAAEQAQNVEG